MRPQGHNLKRTIAISLAFGWISLFNGAYDTIMPIILASPRTSGGLGLSFAATGFVMALDNISGLFMLPLFGRLSDNTTGRFGKRTPYIVIGTLTSVVLWTVAGFLLRLGLPWPFFAALALSITANAAYRPAAIALLPDLTPTEHRRRANAISQIIGIIAMIAGIGLVSIFASKSFDIFFYAESAVMLIFACLFIVFVKEKRWSAQLRNDFDDDIKPADTLPTEIHKKKSSRRFLLITVFFFYTAFNALTSSLSNYAANILNVRNSQFATPQLILLASAGIAALPIGAISSKLRRKPTLLFGLCLMLLAFLVSSFQRSLNAAIIISLLCAGIGYAVAVVNFYPLMIELSDQDKIGKNTGIFDNAAMVAMVITPILSGALSDRYSLSVMFPYCIAALFFAIISLTRL